MKKLLLTTLLLSSCCQDVRISSEEMLKKAEDYCSCHNGVWYVGRLGGSTILEIQCNDGYYITLDEGAIVKRLCK